MYDDVKEIRNLAQMSLHARPAPGCRQGKCRVGHPVRGSLEQFGYPYLPIPLRVLSTTQPQNSDHCGWYRMTWCGQQHSMPTATPLHLHIATHKANTSHASTRDTTLNLF